MVRPITRYHMFMAGYDVIDNDSGVWCRWSEVAPYIREDVLTDIQQAKVAICTWEKTCCCFRLNRKCYYDDVGEPKCEYKQATIS